MKLIRALSIKIMRFILILLNLKTYFKIKNIIFDYCKSHNWILESHDQIFVHRFNTNLNALFPDFWKNHFELKSLNDFPEISWNILDFWCWSWNLDIELGKLWYKIHWVDISCLAIKLANYYLSKEKDLLNSNIVTFEQCDIIVDKSIVKYDSCWSTQVFEHIKDPTQIFQWLRSWIKPWGYILISVPLGYAYDDPDHVNHFANKDELNEFLSNHIKVVRIQVDESYNMLRALCQF